VFGSSTSTALRAEYEYKYEGEGRLVRTLAPPLWNEEWRARAPSPRAFDEGTRTRTPTRSDGAWVEAQRTLERKSWWLTTRRLPVEGLARNTEDRSGLVLGCVLVT
jgi:hypothetical protein